MVTHLWQEDGIPAGKQAGTHALSSTRLLAKPESHRWTVLTAQSLMLGLGSSVRVKAILGTGQGQLLLTWFPAGDKTHGASPELARVLTGQGTHREVPSRSLFVLASSLIAEVGPGRHYPPLRPVLMLLLLPAASVIAAQKC